MVKVPKAAETAFPGRVALVVLHFHKRWPHTGGKSLGHSHQGHGAAIKQWRDLIRPQKMLTAARGRMLFTEQQGPRRGQHVWPHAQTRTCVHLLVCAHLYACTHTPGAHLCTHTCAHTHTPRTRTPMHTHAQHTQAPSAHTPSNPCAHTHAHTVHTPVHTRACTHDYTHPHSARTPSCTHVQTGTLPVCAHTSLNDRSQKVWRARSDLQKRKESGD